jgi:acetyltransferase-like isoleucine patch superfamily enzyme
VGFLTFLRKIYAVIKGFKFIFYGSSKFPRLEGKCKIKNIGKIKIGENFSVNGSQIPVYLTTENKTAELIIGNNVFINYGVDIGCTTRVFIGNNVKIGPLTNIIDKNYHQLDSTTYDIPKPIIIRDNVWIGRGCIILPGVEIGQNSVIAAGSIVTKSIEKDSLVGGSPAKIIKKLNINKDWIRT